MNLHWCHLNRLRYRSHIGIALAASVVEELLVDEQPDNDEDSHEDKGDQWVRIVKLHEGHVKPSLLRTSVVNFDGNLRCRFYSSFKARSGWNSEYNQQYYEPNTAPHSDNGGGGRQKLTVVK